MSRSNLRGTTLLAAGSVAGTVDIVRDTHLAIAARVFRAVGPASTPVRLVHDGIAHGVYAAMRNVATLAGAAASRAAPASPNFKLGARALGALNGAFGDRLAASGNELALEMTVRVGGRDVALRAGAVRAAFPAATGKLAIFIHGLGEVETDWARPRETDGSTYASRLAEELGYTPVLLRYNTGLHVSTNGARLAELLGGLTAVWPVEIHSIALIGHSMGGLVARSACRQASVGKAEWVLLVRHIASLGTPHHGAPLEKAANVVGWALSAFPETRALARLVNVRSSGIKDLRYGSLADADWLDRDPDELLRDNRQEIPFFRGATHYYIGATLTRDVNHPAGRLIGDLLVRMPSAAGRGSRGRRLPFKLEHGRELGGLDHFDLLNHPDVATQLIKWLR